MTVINLVQNNFKTESGRVWIYKYESFTEAMSDGKSHNEQEFIIREAVRREAAGYYSAHSDH